MVRSFSTSAIHITGLAHAYPQHCLDAQDFNELILRLYPDYSASLGLQKLMRLNNRSQIHRRHTVLDFTKLTKKDAHPPSVDELSQMFRRDGVDLAVSASTEAMKEANVSAADITHVVAVTCTDQGNPGYDLLVCQKLRLPQSVQRTLLHGVGCAGGLSALRSAADTAAAESRKHRPACILVIACELCSLFLRAELQAASRDNALHIAPALFSDAAAALVVCNELAIRGDQTPIYELQEWGSMSVPNTTDLMSYAIKSDGMIATITEAVPKTAVGAILPMFNQLYTLAHGSRKPNSLGKASAPKDFDWAIHPGGAAILRGAQRSMDLIDDHIRASLKVYQSHGNSSSPTVLIVLDEMRRMGKGRDDVVATSFGPGMTIEMCMMKRCRATHAAPCLKPRVGMSDRFSLFLPLRLARLKKWYTAARFHSGVKRDHGFSFAL